MEGKKGSGVQRILAPYQNEESYGQGGRDGQLYHSKRRRKERTSEMKPREGGKKSPASAMGGGKGKTKGSRQGSAGRGGGDWRKGRYARYNEFLLIGERDRNSQGVLPRREKWQNAGGKGGSQLKSHGGGGGRRKNARP